MINNQLSIIHRKGVALLVVLFVVMVITITALGFLSKSDVELACGQNMKLRVEMDSTADSGLAHARGLIMSPQDLASEYWSGDAAQQTAGGDDYYDLDIVRDDSDPTDRCNYIIDCNSYRLSGGEKIGRSNIRAQLRLDPCIAYWAGAGTTISQRVTINGDMYCAGNLAGSGAIGGDVFATGTVSGTGIEGRLNQWVAEAPVAWPGIQAGDFSSTYYIGPGAYAPVIVGSYVHPGGNFNPSGSNPGGVRYRNGDAELSGNVTINGLLAIKGDLTIRGSNTVTAVKNFPALLVAGDVTIEAGGKLEINGLIVVGGRVRVSSDDGDLDIVGGLFTRDGLVETVTDSSGNDNSGMMYSTPVWEPSGGQTGGALNFDGVDDYVQTPDNSTKLQLANDYTLSIWIKPDPTQKDWAGVFSKSDPSGSTNHWTLQFNTGVLKRLIIYHPDYLPSPKSWDTGIMLSEIAGGWRHIGVVRSGNVMNSYLEGVPRSSGTWDNNPGSGDGHFNIGVDRTASSNFVYKGLIDDLRIYDRALDPNEICPPVDGLPGLIGHWRLDEGGCDVDITAAPCKSAIMIWSSGGVADKWAQVGGAFFRSIRRRQ